MTAKTTVSKSYEWWCENCGVGDGGFSYREHAEAGAKEHNQEYHKRPAPAKEE